jgi:alpha-1,3-rhamnosyl/mannosyltransferase
MPKAAIRVLVNDRPLRQPLTGVGHYIHQLLAALHALEADSGVRMEPVLFRDAVRPDWQRSAPAPPKATSRGTRAPWWLRRILQGAYGLYLRRRSRGAALYHEPNHIPHACNLPIVTTVHDLSVLAHPEWHPGDRVRWYEEQFLAGALRTTRFIAASEFTKRELVQRIGIAADRIDVTYQAARDRFVQRCDIESIRSTRAQFDLREPYYLFVGTLEPRKNVPLLLEAFTRLPEGVRTRHPLVIAGPWGWKAEQLRREINARALGDQVRLIGYLEDYQLAELLASGMCLGLIWPTLYEGFGLPPLEAMACGAAVVTSNVASLPEVVGEAGLLLDPHDPRPWTAAMQRLIDDPAWRQSLRERSEQQAARFSWQRCAQQTIAVYRAALHDVGR